MKSIKNKYLYYFSLLSMFSVVILHLFVCILITLAASSCQNSRRPVKFRNYPCKPPQLNTVRYDNPSLPIPIESRGRASSHQLVSFFIETNPYIDMDQLYEIANLYIQEAAAEGVNSDVAFCQMVHETNYLRFGGDVKPQQNNFAGIGATGNGNPGHSFPSVPIGIRAQIQHLKAYANDRPLCSKCVDPRFDLVKRAGGKYVNNLTGKWATDPVYGQQIRKRLMELEKFLHNNSYFVYENKS